MGNTSIIWWKIDWFVQLKKLLIDTDLLLQKVAVTTWLIEWFIANFSSERSQQNLDQKENKMASSGSGVEKFWKPCSGAGAGAIKI